MTRIVSLNASACVLFEALKEREFAVEDAALLALRTVFADEVV